MHGYRPYSTMTAKHVEYLRDEVIREEDGVTVGENAANKRVKYLRVMFDWEMKNVEALKDNPARCADLITVATRGYIPWTREDVLTFEDCHPVGTKARLALALYLYKGQRKSDIVQWGPLNARHGRLVYIQHKGRTQKIVSRSIPIMKPLQRILDSTELGKVTWLETEYGVPFSIAGFGHRMRLWCNQAGLYDLTGHGIRKTTGIIAAERGCSAKEIMEILGVTLAVAEAYCEEADKIRLADSGFARAFGDEE